MTSPAARTAQVNRQARGDGEGDEDGQVEGERQHLEPRLPDRHRRHVDQPPPERAGQRRGGEVVPRPRDDQGRLSTKPPRTRRAPSPAIHAAVRHPAPTSSVATPSTTATTASDRQRRPAPARRRAPRRRRRGPCGGPARGSRAAKTPSTRSTRGGRRVGRADADRGAEQVDEPRHGGVGDERRQPPGRDDTRQQRHGGVDDEGGDAGPVGREHGGQPPRAPRRRATISPTTMT